MRIMAHGDYFIVNAFIAYTYRGVFCCCCVSSGGTDGIAYATKMARTNICHLNFKCTLSQSHTKATNES